jgi:hypothetical protein
MKKKKNLYCKIYRTFKIEIKIFNKKYKDYDFLYKKEIKSIIYLFRIDSLREKIIKIDNNDFL